MMSMKKKLTGAYTGATRLIRILVLKPDIQIVDRANLTRIQPIYFQNRNLVRFQPNPYSLNFHWIVLLLHCNFNRLR